jgi:hypothetical protein
MTRLLPRRTPRAASATECPKAPSRGGRPPTCPRGSSRWQNPICSAGKNSAKPIRSRGQSTPLRVRRAGTVMAAGLSGQVPLNKWPIVRPWSVECAVSDYESAPQDALSVGRNAAKLLFFSQYIHRTRSEPQRAALNLYCTNGAYELGCFFEIVNIPTRSVLTPGREAGSIRPQIGFKDLKNDLSCKRFLGDHIVKEGTSYPRGRKGRKRGVVFSCLQL